MTAPVRAASLLLVLALIALGGGLLALHFAGTSPAQAQDGSIPDQPTGLAAEASHNRVNLTWDDPNDDSITHYQVLRRDRAVHDTGEFVTIDSDTKSKAGSTSADTAGASAWPAAWPRTAPPPTRSSARAAGNRAAAWSATTLAANPPDRRYGICNPISFTLITAVHHCPSPSVQGNAIDRDTRDADLSMVSTTRCF